MKLSVIIPARNEESHLPETVTCLMAALDQARVLYEILIVDDHSTDHTADLVKALTQERPQVRLISNTSRPGFGCAVRAGLAAMHGEAVVVVMADGSDAPEDLVTYYHAFQQGVDCVFGSRFIRGASVEGYPWPKLCLNRLANTLIRVLFQIPHNDITNAFKGYRREVVEGVEPLRAQHFNVTVELPLKAIVRGYSYATVPIRWRQRTQGLSKFKIREMGSRYLSIVLSIFLEKCFRGRDGHRCAAARDGS